VPHLKFSSATVILPFVRSLLGLEGDASARKIFFEPRFLGDGDKVQVENYQAAKNHFSFQYERKESKVSLEILSSKKDFYSLHFAPIFSLGIRIRSIELKGKNLLFEMVRSLQATPPSV